MHLALTPVNDRLTVQLQLAGERLREAQAMAANHKPRLAESSLRAYTIIVNDAAVSLKSPATPQATKDALHTLRAKLGAVEHENANRDDDVAAVKQLVSAAIDELDRIEQHESAAEPTLTVGEQATPAPTPVVTPKPTPRTTPTDDGDHGEHRD